MAATAYYLSPGEQNFSRITSSCEISILPSPFPLPELWSTVYIGSVIRTKQKYFVLPRDYSPSTQSELMILQLPSIL